MSLVLIEISSCYRDQTVGFHKAPGDHIDWNLVERIYGSHYGLHII